MYDSESLALTGGGLMIGGAFLGMQWVVLAALLLVLAGLLLIRTVRGKDNH